jgi:fructose-specific phosphotransferase system component IIB
MQTRVTKDEEVATVYQIPAPLVHRLIVAVISGILAIGGYMVVWAINDSAWRTRIEVAMETQGAQIDVIQKQVSGGILPITAAKILEIERRIDRVERDADKAHVKK